MIYNPCFSCVVCHDHQPQVGDTALDMARSGGHLAVARYLITVGESFVTVLWLSSSVSTSTPSIHQNASHMSICGITVHPYLHVGNNFILQEE